MFYNTKILRLLFCLSLSFLISCGTDDDVLEDNEIIQKDAKKEDLVGVWSIFSVELNDVKVDVPINFEECGRDFFIYNDNQYYNEFLFQESSTCIPSQNKLKWTLIDGIITLSTLDGFESEMIKVRSLNKSIFVFTAKIDFDGSGSKETYTFTALKYIPPNEMDIYTPSFFRRDEDPFSGHIEFNWNKYKGYNTFIRYEVYRDTSSDCNINSAELIKTIDDVDASYFIDENPTNTGNLCYFLRIYTNKGLLGESDPKYVAAEFIIPKNVEIKGSSSTDNSVSISWQKYSGFYFSHYEIRVQDQNENSNPKIQTVTTINDINVTTFTDINPPYVNNPVYSIYVHNLFGNVSPLNREKNMTKTNFYRDEILDFDYIRFLSFDAEEYVFYLYATTSSNERRIVKYDYINKTIIAEAFKLPTTQTDVEMQVITSENGKELIFEQGGDYWVYDATDLKFKYSLELDFIGPRDSFAYLKDNIWVFSDNDDVYTFKRNGSEMLKIDEMPHFPDHQGSMNYEITRLDESNVLLSHNNEGRAIHYEINGDGELSNKGIKEIPLLATYNSDITINNTAFLLLNKQRNTVYSAVDFSQVADFVNPLKPSNFNILGTKVFGTDNPGITSGNRDDYKKEVVVYNLSENSVSRLSSKGYPLFIAEDNQGRIISLSSGFQRDDYHDVHNDNVPDMFFEIIE